MFPAQRCGAGGSVMPKMRQFYLVEQWTYGWRAARLGHANGFFAKGSIDPARVYRSW